MRSRAVFIQVLLLASYAGAQAAPDTFQGVERVVAIGDVHADFDRFVGVLRQAKLINTSNRWTGGAAHLVLCGDFIDRGPNSARVMDLIMTLEQQAQRARGRVHALIGNHEAMNMSGDLRYVSPEDFAAFRNRDSERLRELYLSATIEYLKTNGTVLPDEEAFRAQFIAERPLGWVERVQAFLPEGKYGKWLLTHQAIVKINDVLYVHGGLSEKYVDLGLNEINESIRAELRDPNRAPGGITSDELGPLWFRGLIQAPEDDAATLGLVERILEKHAVSHIVVGHTPGTAVMPRFGGRVIGIDVGLARVMGGQPAFLVIEKGEYSVVHQGKQLRLPLQSEGVREYLEAAAALDPPDSRLRIQLQNGRP